MNVQNHNEGTFPNLEDLSKIKEGMTRAQIYDLIGEPHFNEGLRVKNWTYLFHFRTAQGVETCQYNIGFDKDKRAQAFHWNPVTEGTICENASMPKQATTVVKYIEQAAPVVATPAPKTPHRITLTDTFRFDGYALSDLTDEGRAKLNEVARALKDFDDLKGVFVVGHTDHFGTDAYNMDLSQKRADTVARYLIHHAGVAANLVKHMGAGETEPLVHCRADMPKTAQVDCLTPNRRVTVDIDGYLISH
ncbi:OmpA family protein [Moraxella caviae]|nr:OmpA family protein [Moraxella caviae]